MMSRSPSLPSSAPALGGLGDEDERTRSRLTENATKVTETQKAPASPKRDRGLLPPMEE
jgi:hypothetical protein